MRFVYFFLFSAAAAVFAGGFSSRHPEAAAAPVSRPTSVFVVRDDMWRLWRAEREGRIEHITLREHTTVMWPAVGPDSLTV